MLDEDWAKVVPAAEGLDHRWREDFLGKFDKLQGRIRREWATCTVSGSFTTGNVLLTRA